MRLRRIHALLPVIAVGLFGLHHWLSHLALCMQVIKLDT